MKFKYAIALTGGIGSGKSTTTSLLRMYGYSVICADSVAHDALNENTAVIVELFGDSILNNDNTINRKKLGNIVFSNEACKTKLEFVLHPIIKTKICNLALPLEDKKFPYFIDIPLFFETRNYDIDSSLLIYATQEICMDRIIKRNCFTKEEALERIKNQIPIDDKIKMASYVIYNNGTLEELQLEIEKFLSTLHKNT